MRVSPSESATRYKPGTIKRGNDSRDWIVSVASNGTHRWTPRGKATQSQGGLWDPGNYFFKSMKTYLDREEYGDILRYGGIWEKKLIPAARELANSGILLLVKPIGYGDPGMAEDDLEFYFTKNEKKYEKFLLNKVPKYALNISDEYAFIYYMGQEDDSSIVLQHNLDDPKLRQITNDVLSRIFGSDYKWNKSLRTTILIRAKDSGKFPTKDFVKPLIDKLKKYDGAVKIVRRGTAAKPATSISFSMDPEELYKIVKGFGLRYHDTPDVDEDSFHVERHNLYVNFYDGISVRVYNAITS